MKIRGVITVNVRARTGVQHDWAGSAWTGWGTIHQLNPSHNVKKMTNPQLQLLSKYTVVFGESHQAVKIYVSDNAVPKYYKSRPLPYVMRNMVNKELDRLLSGDIIEPF